MRSTNRSVFLMGTASLALAGLPRRLRAQATTLTTIRLGTAFNDDATPVVYAQKAGIFAKYGLDAQILKALGPAAAGMLGGSFDFGKSAAPAALQAHENGLPLALVAAASVVNINAPYTAFLMEKDAPAGGKDFEGKTIGLGQLKSLGDVSLKKFVQANGGDPSTITFVEVPIPSAAGAVDTDRVYASECAYPLVQVGLDTGRMKTVNFYRELGSGTVLTAWAVNLDFSAKNPDVVRAFARAWREAVIYTNANHGATVSMMADFTAVPAEVIAKMPRATATPTLVPAQVQPLIDDCVKYGALKASFRAADAIDPNIRI